MKTKILVLTALLFSISTFAQKATVEKGVIYTNEQPIAEIEKDGCSLFSSACTYYIRNKNGKSLMTINALTMNDPTMAGMTNYLRFSFYGFDQAAEIPNPALFNAKAKNLARTIVKARLIKNDDLDSIAVKNFINAHGERFTERQKMLSPKVIILDESR